MQTVLTTGVPKTARVVDLLALADLLNAAIASPAKAAEIAHRAFETAAKVNAPIGQLACIKGCAFCCYGMVAITAPEAFRLSVVLRSRGAEAIATFRAKASATANKSAAERFGAKLPCALLKDNACSVYDARPLSCRQVTSTAVAPCLDEFEGRDGDILIPEHYTAHAGNALIALAAALIISGYPVRMYELSAAVICVLDTPNAEQRWLAGDDIFARMFEDQSGVSGIARAAQALLSHLQA